MTPAKQILEIIETVDPADSAKLDEIDARVHCFRHYPKAEPDEMVFELDGNGNILPGEPKHEFWKEYGLNQYMRYTRSRDALKAIRPEGYMVKIEVAYLGDAFPSEKELSNLCRCSMLPMFSPNGPYNGYMPVSSAQLPTEELAELSAIIQAISYERGEG